MQPFEQPSESLPRPQGGHSVWRGALSDPVLVLVWAMAGGVLLWGSGADLWVQRWLYAHYHQPMNTAMRWLSLLMLGRTLVWGCLLAGLVLAVRTARPKQPLRFVAHGLIGCVTQLREWLLGRARWTPYWREISDVRARCLLLVLPTLMVAGFFQLLLKCVVGRPRPKEVFWNDSSAYQLQPVWLHDGVNASFLSFPSGHSCSTWVVAVLLMHAWPRHAWLLGIAAGLVSMARFLAVTPHYPGDVLAGAGLGAAIGLIVARKMGLRTAAMVARRGVPVQG